MGCPVAETLDVVGEWWTLLVIRDVFRGIRRFDALQENLGIARNILTRRLKALTEAGILEKRAYEERAGGIWGMKGSFLFRSLRPHPRFQALLARMNLAD